MMKKSSKIKFLEDIALSDTAFEVRGNSINELFENASQAIVLSMANPAKIENKIKKNVKISQNSLDLLLFDYLNEILFFKDSENLIFSEANVEIQKNEKYLLDANLYGEKINPSKHEISTDIKAVTLHMFKVTESKGKYEARVILDI